MSHVELFLVYNKAQPHQGQAEENFLPKSPPVWSPLMLVTLKKDMLEKKSSSDEHDSMSHVFGSSRRRFAA